MALTFQTPFYVDGNFNTAEPVGLPVFSSPIRSTTAEYVVTQDFMQFRSAFSPTPLDTGWFRDKSYKLVSEGPRQDVGGGIVKWTRTYAQVPEPHDEFESYSYSFIGFLGVWTVGNIGTSVQATGRPRQSRVVTSRVLHEYFRTTDPGSIAVVQGQRYLATSTIGPNGPLDVDYLFDADPPAITSDSSPSRTEYNALITDESEIVAETSRLSRWMGNVWLRQTRYIKAE